VDEEAEAVDEAAEAVDEVTATGRAAEALPVPDQLRKMSDPPSRETPTA
jgi:hypothetical protein